MAIRTLTLELPTLLHQRLEEMARDEGVSLAQYVLDVLTRQAELPYRVEIAPPEVQEQTVAQAAIEVK